MIKDDNRRTGIRQSSEVRSGASISRPLSSESTPLSPRYQNDGRPLSVPIAPSKSSPIPFTLLQPRSFAAPFVQDGLAPPSAPARPRPPVHPKPQNLHGIVIASDGRQTIVKSNTSNMNGLTERFSQLRTTNGSLETSHRGHNSVQSHHPDPRYAESNGYSNVSYIFGSDRSSGFDYQSSSQQSNGDFNTIPSNGQPYLNHISINPSLSKDLPKAPSPTYSPVRSMQTGPPMQPPRSSVRTPVAGRPPSAASHDFVNHQLATNDYFASGEGSVHHPEKTRPPQMRRKSINLPLETKINAEKLYDYLKTFDVLLIDVRSREDYDAGHIFSTNGMCIEPAALRLNMSADELQESLVLSPEAEQVLFDQRDEFDLVVYYDQSTDSTDFLKNHENPRSKAPLRYLYDALYEFNQEKPLRWAPILLVGGMDAWVDLLGGQALATSNTAVSRKATRPLARRPLTKNSSRLTITKKRRDYNPLDPEEEKKWRERARSESINLDSRPLKDVDIEEEVIEAESQLNARGYDKFATRFPEVAAVETQSIPIQLSLPPEPPRVPSYPTPPASNYQAASASTPINVPNVPSRPPPSVPRPSYSGVSDRVVPQTVVTTRTSQLAPYIPPELRQLPRTGLHNFGVTCYMNATIQCLSATIPLTAFFLDGAFYKYIQRDNWKGSKGLMPELYNTLLRNLWTANQIDTIRPTNFRVSSTLCAAYSSNQNLTLYRNFALASTRNGVLTGNRTPKNSLNSLLTAFMKTSMLNGHATRSALSPRMKNQSGNARPPLSHPSANGYATSTETIPALPTSSPANTFLAYNAQRATIPLQLTSPSTASLSRSLSPKSARNPSPSPTASAVTAPPKCSLARKSGAVPTAAASVRPQNA